MAPIAQGQVVYEGADWSASYVHRDAAGAAVDLTGYTARMNVAEYIGGLAVAYLSSGADTQNGTIEITAGTGTVTLSMTAAQTDALSDGLYLLLSGARSSDQERRREFRYSLDLVDGDGVVTRALVGPFIVECNVVG